MASLVFVTQETRIVLKYGAILSIFLVILFFVVKGLLYVQNVLYPKAPIPPKEEFGKLPQLIFPTNEASGLTYRINTLEGNLPDLPYKANVYRLIQPQPDLLALNKANGIIHNVYSLTDPKRITDAIYQWNSIYDDTSVQYNIVTKNFKVASNYLDNPSFASTNILPDANRIKTDVEIFLQKMGANQTDIDREKTKVTYLQMIGRLLVAADNLGTAKYARVDLKQKPVDGIPIIYPSPTESILSFIVSYPNSSFTVLDGQYFHYLPDLDNKSDYLIKTSQQAFEDLKNGNAVVLNPSKINPVDITELELQYYLDQNTDKYLQPIIVFKGINFTAYVDAIPKESLE